MDKFKKATLILKNSDVSIECNSFGYEQSVSGELVFNTGMVGYPESLTDPSYAGQILIMTFPIVGVYGVPGNEKDKNGLLKYFESNKIHIKALIVSNYSDTYEHYDAVKSLGSWLKENKIPAFCDVDTRLLTKLIRDKGSMIGKIEFSGSNIEYTDPNKANLVEQVSTKEKYTIGNGSKKILVIDCGCKKSILSNLLKYDTKLLVVPWDYDFSSEEFDGILLSNGPGNPLMMNVLVERVKAFLEKDVPIFGICLGNQVLALAAGAKTYKMKFGNRSMNQPVIDLRDSRCYITSQNHGYAVDENTLPKEWKPLFINGNDNSNEGIMHTNKPFFSVQFHPEGNGGPKDTNFVFDMFMELIETKNFPNKNIKFSKTKKVQKVLVLGSGGISIGQAGEFDYSGSQCIKALKEENVEIVLVNPNVSTVQTSDYMADKTYFLPVIFDTVRNVIEKEKPDGILLQFGGQTALNCGIELDKAGVLTEYNIEVMGTSIDTIIMTEDRVEFNKKLEEIDEKVIPTAIVTSEDEAVEWSDKIGYPVLVRTNYTLGGLGSGFAKNEMEVRSLYNLACGKSSEIIISKSLLGWKEIEYEVLRDVEDNCIVVCNMENIDPAGVHTGDSIVIAPSLTLNNNEYYKLRESSINIARHLDIVGECNVQFVLDLNSNQYYVIEVNARLSRSSALASKVTGYPLAYIAAKICLGSALIKLQNSITKSTIACFEPSLDYCVIKFPRWDNQKFTDLSNRLGTAMKSIGETMSIGRNFEETFLKSVRMTYETFDTLKNTPQHIKDMDKKELIFELENPSDKRVFILFECFYRGMTVDEVFLSVPINKWYLNKINNLVKLEKELSNKKDALQDKNFLLHIKKMGFSDIQISKILGIEESKVRNCRKENNIAPYVKQIDTLAAEFPTKTNYLYCTYSGMENDLDFNNNGVIVLGCGAYRIGSSCEFDWSAVSCLRALKKMQHYSIIINNNPETVSTDYDESDRLYFEELSLERVLEIYEQENSSGVIVSVGGQISNQLALPLSINGAKILGTQPQNIDNAEDRNKFSQLLDSIGVDQPEWKELSDRKDIDMFVEEMGFPLIIRPSYVLSGSSMIVAYTKEDINEYLSKDIYINSEYPIVISKFIEESKEIEFDGVASSGNLINYAISEHVENAGVHSGDATLILPAQKLYTETKRQICSISKKICKSLNITGPFNIQYLSKDNKIRVIECNLRASRSFPFVSKTFNINFIELATRAIMGIDVKTVPIDIDNLEYINIKCPMFSFSRLEGVDPLLKVEMSSTGEVACIGYNKYEAYLNSVISSGVNIPKVKTALISIGPTKDKGEFINSVKNLISIGYKIYTTKGTHNFFQLENIDTEILNIENSDKKDSAIKYIIEKKIGIVVNIPNNKNVSTKSKTSGFYLRRCAVDNNICLLTNIKNSKFLISSLYNLAKNKYSVNNVRSWQEYLYMSQKNNL